MHSKIRIIIGLFAAIVFFPAIATAEGGGLSQDAFQTLLTLIVVISVAYIVSHVFSAWISRRWGIETGAEYIVVGATVGPGLLLLGPETLSQLSPAIVLAQGSLGLYAGILFNLKRIRWQSLGIGSVVSLITLIVVGGTPLILSYYTIGPDRTLNLLPHILCAAAIAMVAERGPLRTLAHFLQAKGDAAQLIQQTAIVASGCAIVVFGIIFCLFKPASDLIPDLTFTDWQSILFWLAVHITIGLVLGAIFALFLVSDYEDEQILTVVIGMVIFTSGVAFYLKLSPIFVCFALGVTFTHLCPQVGHVERMLESIEKPLYHVMYFFLGANLTAVAWWSVLLVFPYFLLRHLGRGLGAVMARELSDVSRQMPLVGRALWAPGALSAAMALNYIGVFKDFEFAEELFVALMVAILFSEAIAYRFGRIWLIDATDVALVREGDEST